MLADAKYGWTRWALVALGVIPTLVVAAPYPPDTTEEAALANWDDNDPGLTADALYLDGDLIAKAGRISRGGEDMVKLTWNTGFPPSPGDTVTLHVKKLRNSGVCRLSPYDFSTTIDNTNVLDATPCTPAPCAYSFTLSSGFVGALGDLGGGSFAMRYTCGGANLLDRTEITEIEVDLTPPSVCGDGTLDAGEDCDDGNTTPGDCCSPTCTIEPAGTQCRASTGECDPAETCDGISDTCPVDGFVAAGWQCTDLTPNDCDDAQCDGAGACNQAWDMEIFGYVCRADNLGGCDVDEVCDGASGGPCPADVGVAANTVCNPSIGECDLDETCDGSSAACPVDAFVAAATQCTDSTPGDCDDAQCDGAGACNQAWDTEIFGYVCRAVADVCDVAETCDGIIGGACTADVVESAATVCRPSTDECDPQETCDGSSVTCPADDFLPNGTTCTDDSLDCTNDFCQSGLCTHPVQVAGIVCRATTGPCDPEETCDGSSTTCPADALEPDTTVCRPSAGLCDPEEMCDGASAGCPTDDREPGGTVCRPSTDECDPQEECDGVAALCPSDSFKPDGEACTDDGLLCSNDTCQTGVCSHTAKTGGTVCRVSTDECDPQEECDGAALTCPADSFEVDGFACTDEPDACTSDTCSSGVCTHTDTTPAGDCCDPLTGGLTTIDDADPCTLDVCNPDGTVDHNPAGQLTVNLKVQALLPPSPPVTRDVTFIITVCGGSVDTRVVPVAFNGFGQATVILDSVDANASWINVSEAHTLSRLEPLTITACSGLVDLAARQLLAGDLQTATEPQDNLDDITDFSILASRWNDAINPDFSVGADVTGNGVQDLGDFTAMQANFFVVGEATDQCTLSMVDGGLQPVEAELVPVIRQLQAMPRSSIAVDTLAFPDAHRADINGDGVVDTRDIRAFARQHRLELLPEFRRTLDKLEARKTRGTRGRR